MAGNDIEYLKQQQAKLHRVADRGTPATIAAHLVRRQRGGMAARYQRNSLSACVASAC